MQAAALAQAPRPNPFGAADAVDRLAGLARPLALVLALAIAALIVLGLVGGPQPTPAARPGPGDLALYQSIIETVHTGAPYYTTAVRAQRAGLYPLRPFVAVRLSTLATAMAALPNEAARRLSIRVLAVATFVAWAWRFWGLRDRPAYLAAAFVILSTGISPSLYAKAYLLHEFWAGLLIALSLALHRPGRWLPSLILGLIAVSVRELAAPYLLAMGVLAWRDGDRTESVAWFLGIAAFLAGMAFQASAVQPLLRPSDLASQGWLGLGGWRYLLSLLRWNLPLIAAPAWVLAVIAPFALLGLLARGGPLGDRLALTVIGYGAAFLVVGRPDNDYWGLMIAPLWPIGLIAAWPALNTLAARLRQGG